MADFYIKQNDTRPYLEATLQDSAGDAVNLTGASVRFHMGSIDAAATIVDAATGSVRYEWQAGDTSTTGFFNFELEATYADGGVETWPNHGTWTIQISPEIA